MLPRNMISAVPQYAGYLNPDAIDLLPLESLEYGGVAINDATQGRLVQVWRAYLQAGAIKIEPKVAATPTTTLVSGLGTVTSLSLAFDSNMAPTICYVEGGVLKLRWYNTVTGAFQIDSFTGESGRVSTDDKRKSQEGASDVIFAYTKVRVLYWRQQRDRYTAEYTVGPSGKQILRRLGLTLNNRLQFELVDP